jgi:predicted MFS family arabinose efflux permease
MIALASSSGVRRARPDAVLVTLLAGQFMANLDTAIINLAVPSIGATLHASGSALQWTAAAYVLTSALFLIGAARLGSLAGRRTIFLIGLGLFTAASLLCGTAPSVAVLIAGRAVQGIGAALMVAQVLSGIQLRYSRPARARALGAYTMTLSAAAVLGQVLGGALVTADIGGSAWRPLFLINVPIGAVLLFFAARVLPPDEAPPQRDGWRAGRIARVLLPLIDTRLFAMRGVSLGLVASALTRVTYFSLLFVIALYLQNGCGRSAFSAGLALLAWVAAYGVAGPVYPRLPAGVARRSAPLGCLVVALAYGGLAAVSAAGSAGGPLFVLFLGIGGFGFGIVSTALVVHLTGIVPAAHASGFSGVMSTLVPLSAVAGVATFGSLYLALAGRAVPGAATQGFAVTCSAFAVSAGLAAVAAARSLRQARS